MPPSANLDSSPEIEVIGSEAVRMTDENTATTWNSVDEIQSLMDEVVGAFKWKAIPALWKDMVV
jgi:hypothetical protein